MPRRLVVPCPAKVNLFLAVGRKDARGYHPLRTVFQAVGLFDELTIDLDATGLEVEFNHPGVPARNTVTRALGLLEEVVDVPPMRIRVQKRIPMESGLGGGSSDAAGLIRALKHLMPGRFSLPELDAVALATGADVPFFLVGGRAKAEGYGELLTALPDTATEHLVIVKPEVSCPTAEAFARLDATPYEWRDFPASDGLYNDFERVAPCECLELIERLQRLGAADAGLSGSGSAVYGRFPSKEDADRARGQAEIERLGQAWSVPTLTRAESLIVRD